MLVNGVLQSRNLPSMRPGRLPPLEPFHIHSWLMPMHNNTNDYTKRFFEKQIYCSKCRGCRQFTFEPTVTEQSPPKILWVRRLGLAGEYIVEKIDCTTYPLADISLLLLPNPPYKSKPSTEHTTKHDGHQYTSHISNHNYPSAIANLPFPEARPSSATLGVAPRTTVTRHLKCPQSVPLSVI